MSREDSAESNVAVGVAWFDRDQWKRLKEIAPDRGALDDTFEDWERNARRLMAKITADGHRVEAVPVDIDQLLAWCTLQGIAPDGKARASYVTHLLRTRRRDV